MALSDDERREYVRDNKQEKRQYARAVIRLETKIRAAGDRQVSGWTRDVSVKGAYVLCTEHFPEGAKCVCRLALGDVFKEAPILEVSGWVVRCDGAGVAVQFVDYAVDCIKKFQGFFGPQA